MKNSEIQSCIEHVPIFKNLSQEEKDEIIKIAKHYNYKKDNLLYTTGDSLDALYIVHEGSIKINRYTKDGREQVLRVLRHGDFLGETALFGNLNSNSNAEILEEAVICQIDRLSLSKIIDKMPSIARKMLFELSKRLDHAEDNLTSNSLQSAEAKLAKLLIETEENYKVVFKTTKKTLASSLGMTPETFSRKLRQFEDQGLIKIISNKVVEIMDIVELDNLIEI